MKKHVIMNNSGFSLVELIVTLLITSFVVLAASMFISAGTRAYTTNNDEVSLQMESQIALNLIENYVLESTSCEFLPDYNYGTGSCDVLKIGTPDNLRLVIFDAERSRLLFVSIPAISGVDYSNIIGTLKNETGMQTAIKSAIEASAAGKPALLANYINSIDFYPSKILDSDDELVRIDITLKKNNRTYSSSTSVSMRNGVHR